MNKEKISFVIPCYNSELTIETVVNGIVDSVKDKYDYQIILSNDGSKDGVWNVIRKLCEKDDKVKGVCLARNFGQQSARMAAIPYVNGDYVIFMDDDGQHPAEGIELLIDKLREGYDIAYAYFKKKKESLFRVIVSDFNQFTMGWLMGKPKEVKLSSFFAVRRFVADELLKYNSPMPMINGYFLQVTKNIISVELNHKERLSGKTGYNFKKLFRLWLNNFTSFSIEPLRLSSLLGFTMSGIGMIWALCIAIKKIMIPEVPIGYTSIIVVILICSGLLMFMLGLIGEYIGRLFIAQNNVPQYVIRETINFENER